LKFSSTRFRRHPEAELGLDEEQHLQERHRVHAGHLEVVVGLNLTTADMMVVLMKAVTGPATLGIEPGEVPGWWVTM